MYRGLLHERQLVHSRTSRRRQKCRRLRRKTLRTPLRTKVIDFALIFVGAPGLVVINTHPANQIPFAHTSAHDRQSMVFHNWKFPRAVSHHTMLDESRIHCAKAENFLHWEVGPVEATISSLNLPSLI